MTPLRHAVACAAALLFVLPAAQAATLGHTGTTAGGPTFQRPLETLDFVPMTDVPSHYFAYEFSVDTSGFYDFLSVAAGWDNFTVLYGPGFDPTTPLTAALVANDDFGMTTGMSGFSQGLTAGVRYTFVTTGFDGATDFGAFTNSITGPGAISPVPEPASWALLAAGLLLVASRGRRRTGR